MRAKKEEKSGSSTTKLEEQLAAISSELSRKNRDLEIEASLERVRAVAMGMNQSDDLLSICETMFHELKKLGFDDLRNAMIDIHYEAKAYLLNYDYSDNTGKTITTFKYNSHPIVDNLIYHAKQSSEAFTEMVYSGKALDDWRIFRKQNGEADDPGIENIEALYYYFYSIGTGAIGISTFSAANPEQLNVLKRFRNVFDLAYRRYTDIQLAENQTREAQIELALERVRARTIAMQHSDELVDAAAILFKQVKDLSVEVWTCGFQIWKPGEPGTTVAYMTLPDGTIRVPFDIPHPPEPFLNRAYEAAVRGDQFYVEEIGGEALAAHYKYMLALPGSSDRMVDISAGGFHLPEFQVNHNAYFSQGALLFITYKPVPQSWDIFKRFAKVFEQTYTRFLDLKKAEAQAREALIEGALERVRSRAMAMHKTDELREAAELLAKELTGLGIESITVCYVLVNEKDKTGAYYGVNPIDGKIQAQPTIMPHTETKVMRALWASWLKQEPVHFIALDLKASIAHQTYIGKLIASAFAAQGIAPEFTVEGFLSESPERVHIYSLNFKQGYLFLVGEAPLPAADVDILIRFTKVFELTYTRFLDLKQAEEQAREAKIEAALERVRSRTMAMQHSSELAETVSVLFAQLLGLGITPDQIRTCGIVTFDAEEPIGETWITETNGDINPVAFKSQYDEAPAYKKIYAAWKKGEKFEVLHLQGEKLTEHLGYVVKYAPVHIRDIDAPELPTEIWQHVLFFSQGYLFVITREPLPEYHDVFKRFGAVLQQSYTRFLDLQKAEAQAREGKIELALERVRARTMAMQHSDELAETAFILFQQFRELGENPDQATIGIINEAEGVIEYWVTIYGNQTNKVFKFPIDEPNVTCKIYDAWKAQEKSLVIDLSGQALYDFSKFRESMGGAGYNEAEQRRIINVAFFSKGLINVQSTVTRSAESLRLLERFANVFEGTYTRFLDLKKAEAQAREGQIELALERVRARAMAMRDSKELSEMVSTVFGELTKLDFSLTRCAIVIADSESGGRMIWMANSEAGQPPISFYRKSLDHPYPNAVNEEWKKRTTKWVYHLKGAEKKGMDDYYANSEEVAHLSSVIKQAMDMPESIILSHSFNNFGYLRADSLEFLSEANLDILYRFAKVFDLGYTRFTDIKQAEAQAREAQIELALERVRAKTMAMQHSDELLETSQVVFQQLRDLGETADQISIAIVKEDEGIFDLFATIYGTQMVRVVHPKIDDHYVMGRVYKNWKAHKKSFVVELVGEELRQYNILRNQLGGVDYYNEIIGPDDRWNVSCASFSRGILSFSSSTEPTKEAGQLLERFAKVFDSTYTRFLDLKKAEAQARESQIQLALERIRARTMAMQKSNELAETVSLVFKQLLALGIRTEQIRTCGIVTFNGDQPVGEQWITETNGEIIPQSFIVPYNEAPAYKAIYKGWKDGEKFMVIHLEGKALKEHLGYLAKGTNVPTRDVILPQQAKEIFNHVLFFSQGCLFIITKEALPEYHDVFKRFGAVFQQSYTRFLDLKKAEAQAREGQIQLAMERVRARTMAMQHSDELMEASHLLDSQVRALGIRTRGCAFNIYGENESTEWFGLETGPLVYKTPREEAFLLYYEAGQRGDSLYINEFAGDACKAHYEYLCTLPDVGDALKKMRDNGQPFPAYQIDHVVYFKFGYLLFATFEPVPEAHEIFKRFAAVFEQTYTRFLDLQKAEAQAREGQIEAALERVRSRSMGMQKSDELKEVIQIIYEQFVHLNISIEHTGFVVDYSPGGDWHFWIADHLGSPNKLTIPDFDSAWCNDFNEAKEKGIDFFTTNLDFDEKNKFYHDLFELAPGMPEQARELIFSKPGLAGSTVLLENVALYIENFSGTPYTDEENATLMRFGKVFQQTYTRFLDLQKAEAQAREAKIEAALEKIRSRSLAMHQSMELLEVVTVVFEKLQELEVPVTSAGINIYIEGSKDADVYVCGQNENGLVISSYRLPFFDHPIEHDMFNGWQKGLDFLVKTYPFEEKNSFYNYLFDHSDLKYLPGDIKSLILQSEDYTLSMAFSKNSMIVINHFDGKLLSEMEIDIIKRFAKVFEQAYVRFLDLQKAEAQAREGQIEAALERVRSRTMSMHNSQDVGDTIVTLFDELTRLGFATLRCSIDILNDTSMMEIWTAKPGENGKADLVIGHLDTALHPMLGAMYNAWKAKKPDFFYELAGDDQARYLTALNEYSGYAINYEIASMPARQFLNTFFFADGGILAWTAEPLHAEASMILTRFASVFGQTYRRYLDLQKAETQAREAQIEMALERVRAVAMSMRKPGELLEISQTIFTQLKALDFADLRNTEIIINSDEKESVISYYYSDYGVTGIIEVFFNEHPTVKAWANEMRKANDAFTEMVIPEDEIAAWRKYREEIGYRADPKLDEAKEVFYYSYSIGLGGLSISSFTPINDEQRKILERFRNVFNLSYQRYADIARAEEQAREAIKQASLDRVRAEIASMRTTGDLERITPLVWDELTILGIPFIRCGVFIVDEAVELIHTHLSTPNGKALAAFNLAFDADGIGQTVLSAWRRKEMATGHWTAEEFAANTKNLVDQGAVISKERFVTEHPDTSLDLHFFPFLQGMLYVGNIAPLSDDAKDLVQSLAEAFSTAYARYEDFNKLEAAKQQVDKTLTDLKAAQTQLIQTEKMASLGELTAGIAHEIQNPLNFVNNFSEVNAELIEEMKAEIEKGDLEEIRALALDIEENSKKINQHGKRADGIVKGMLQHSQSGSGVKELININTVADEYMRLAYHGLRAKDKSFNAEMHTYFDPALPKINVIPQDIGRVLLNLFNNAFYAVNQKMKTAGGDYKPMVEVETFFLPLRGVGGLKVKDNGIGIPDAIKEKIMQPFFTTKPTGEGTGLGLSLTYDMVVKGHGGSIQVNSVEGEGSEFIITLPIS